MKWFKHFSNAHDSQDLTKVRMKYGADGYAIYWYCLELISSDLGMEENITFELKHDAEVIGFNLKIDQLLVEEIMTFMVGLGLFEQSNNIITCLDLAKHLDKRITRNSTIHKIIDFHSMQTQAYKSVSDKAGQTETVPDCPRSSPLDTDTDTDTEKIKIKAKQGRFAPPSIQEVIKYCTERKNNIDPQKFLDHYETNGWMRGKNKIKCWKACVRTWEGNEKPKQKATTETWI